MKRLLGMGETKQETKGETKMTMEEVVASKKGDQLAELVKDKLGDESAALKLLQDAVAALAAPRASAPVVSEDAIVASEAAMVTLAAVSSATPRGRFNLSLTDEGVVCQGKTVSFQFTWSDVQHLLKLPKWEQTRKPGSAAKSYWVVLVLERSFQVGKQQHQCLVLTANGVKAPEKVPVLGSSSSERKHRCAEALKALEPETAEVTVLSNLFAACLGIEKATEPQSSVCMVEAIQAWAERDEGVIFPLGVGLCFLPKPAIFVPAEDMMQAEAGTCRGPRGGDFILHRVQSRTPVKFQNIAGNDSTALLQYVSAMACQCRTEGGGDAPALDEEEDDSDYEDEGVRPAKRRVVTRSQGATTDDLVTDLPGRRKKKEKEEAERSESEDFDESESVEEILAD